MIGSKGCDSPGCVCCSGPDRPALSQSAEARPSEAFDSEIGIPTRLYAYTAFEQAHKDLDNKLTYISNTIHNPS